MKRIIICLILLKCFVASSFGQTATVIVDTSAHRLKPDISNFSWNAKLTNGIQRSYFFDIGISRTSFMGSPHGLFGTALSLCYSMFPSFNSNVNTSTWSQRQHGGLWQFYGCRIGYGLLRHG